MKDRGHGMLARRAMLALLAGGAAMLLAGCEPGDVGSSRVYFEPIRYRLTAEVETPEGISTGSSVIQTIWDRGLSGATVTGEAVAVDLPKGETLFVLLRTENNPDWAGGIPGIRAPRHEGPLSTAEEREGDAARSLTWIRANRDVHYLWGQNVPKDRAQYLPYMVRFRDIRAPKSIERVKPDDLSAIFGSGYRLKSLTVQITDEPVTTGIERRFPWWTGFKDRHFDGTSTVSEDMTNPNIAAHLTSGSFSTEYRK
ncbi:MAG: hypothetical protein ACSLE1_09285 [Sphingobium sp.]